MEQPDRYPISSLQFLKALFGQVQNGYLEITCLAPGGVQIYPHTLVMWKPMPMGAIDPAMPGVTAANRRGYGVSFGATIRERMYAPEERISESSGKPYTFYARGKAHDARWLTTLWVDVDEAGDAGYRRCIGALAAQPSIVVSSGGGWHGYWLLTEPLLLDEHHRDMAKLTLKGMALAAKSDANVADLARVMRLPGTVNTKPERNGARCEVVDYFPVRYRYQEFEDAFAPLAAPKNPIRREVPASASSGLKPWCVNYLSTGAQRGERNKMAYAVARAMLDNGISAADMEVAITARALADGLDQREIEAVIKSALNAPTGTPNMPAYMQTRMSTADRRRKRTL